MKRFTLLTDYFHKARFATLQIILRLFNVSVIYGCEFNEVVNLKPRGKSFLVCDNVMTRGIIIALLFIIPVSAQIRELGTITTTNAIGWDAVPKVTGYHLYLGPTNAMILSNRVATVTLPRWEGTNTASIHGWKALEATAFIMTPEGDTDESARSERVAVLFRAGVPVPPRNFQLFSVIQAAATNALTVLPPIPASP